ncbi:putative carboxylesterase family protein [Diplodia seriata]|uniref:Putative carboxylesterase family protein n=1 Tax=Diplodia seriata TaxID=420778 RepID=A0A0G2FSI5_9PEZI|nr:putative carboxylesterase family protein [Diplodia seriata]
MTGSKNSAGNPAGLIRRSHRSHRGNDNDDGIIFVSINYRLGAFGFLSTPPPRPNDITPNAALHDQRLALRWVQSHIHLFGGDRARVTAMGESAGAGAIAHHITAYGGGAVDEPVPVYPIVQDWGREHDGRDVARRVGGGRGKLDDFGDDDDGDDKEEKEEKEKGTPPLFHRAILESPGWYPPLGARKVAEGFRAFLEYAGGVKDVTELRALPSWRLMEANRAMRRAAAPGSFVFGPVVDGGLVRADPRATLLRVYGGVNGDGGGGESVGGVQAVLIGRSADEGRLFVPPELQTEEQFEAFVRAVYGPDRDNSIRYIVEILYPPVYTGWHALYADVQQRAALLLSDWTGWGEGCGIVCLSL